MKNKPNLVSVDKKNLVEIPNDVSNVIKWIESNRTEIHSKIVYACKDFVENDKDSVIIIARQGQKAFGIKPSGAKKALQKAMEWFISDGVEEYEKAAKARDLIKILNEKYN